MRANVINLDNAKVGTIDLADGIFDLPVRADILSRMVNWQLAKRRAGTHKKRGSTTARGTTARPCRPKGRGRAGQDTRGAPQHRGGAVVFGPVVRSHAQKLPKKVRRLALKTALSSKQADGKLVVLDEAKLKEAKAGGLAQKLAKLGWSSVLVIDGSAVDVNFSRAAANLPNVDVLPSQGANVYDILRRDTLVLTKDAVLQLEARLK